MINEDVSTINTMEIDGINCLVINIKRFLYYLDLARSTETGKEEIRKAIVRSLNFIKGNTENFVIINSGGYEVFGLSNNSKSDNDINLDNAIKLSYRYIVDRGYLFKTNDFTELKDYWLEIKNNMKKSQLLDEEAEIIEDAINQV